MECTVKYENDTFSVKIAIKTKECIALCATLVAFAFVSRFV